MQLCRSHLNRLVSGAAEAGVRAITSTAQQCRPAAPTSRTLVANCRGGARGIASMSEHVKSAALDSLTSDGFHLADTDLDAAFLERPLILSRAAEDKSDTDTIKWNSSGTLEASVPGEDACSHVNPFELVSGDMKRLNGNIKELLGSDHPVLETVAQYFFSHEGGKKIRPSMVLLMSRACNAHALQLNGDHAGASTSPTARQIRLAEISEMIHTASLLHDDVIDMADSRRGVHSVNRNFGNKLAVLAGDFLLARSSVCLARLRDVEVIELLATVIEHLVKGEVMQIKGVRGIDASSSPFDLYIRKNYYKTGSLMANSCRAAAMLHEDVPEDARRAAFVYGRAVGSAFQLIDDVLDFEATEDALGKPVLNDLRQGLSTAPVLFAHQQFPKLGDLMGRKFEAPGDVEMAHDMVLRSDGLQRTKDLAVDYSNQAVEAILRLKPSPARDALVNLARQVVYREH